MEGTLKEKIEALRNQLDAMDDDVKKSDEGTMIAGGRARKQLQELKQLAQVARIFCLERDHARKAEAKAK